MRAVLIATLLSLLACSSSSSPADEPWVGSWTRAGTQVTMCGGVSTTTQLAGTVTISLGAATGTVEASVEILSCPFAGCTSTTNCSLLLSVTGDSATLGPGQSCAASVDGADATITFATGTDTLDDDTITSNATGTSSNGCTVAQQYTLTRTVRPPPMH